MIKPSMPQNVLTGHPRLTPLAEAVRSLILGGMAIGGGAPASAALPVPAEVLPTDVLPVPTGGAGFVTSGDVDRPAVNGRSMTIRQHSPKAVLDWQSFDIARSYSVNFKQPDATSIALNNIHQSDPSQILGTLTANGQIYLVNQNGFLFGRDARVDTNTLVATTLNISQDTLDRGLSKAINQNGNPALTKDPSLTGKFEVYRKDEQGNVLTDAEGHPLKREIRIEEGARIASQEGGRIMVFAPSIVNRGTLKTPGGQAILAAATDKVYLQEAVADSDATSDPDKMRARNYVRGLLVEVGTGGSVSNLGHIAANRGNITLAGFAVNQEGMVSATTSVRLNGSVRLIAREKGDKPVLLDGTTKLFDLQPDSTERAEDRGDGLGTSARVVLDQGSVTRVLPETGSKERALADQPQERSRVEIMGKQVEIRESALVSVPSGKVTVQATTTPIDPTNINQGNKDVTIDVKLGARIDVAGLKNVEVPVSKNIVEVEPRSFELRDAPLQKTGPLYGKKIYVDIRNGLPKIVDIGGSVARIEYSVAERSVTGGEITLSSAGDVNVQQEATLDVSGGSIEYQSGYVKTTWLSSEGRYYEISGADPNRRYDGILGQVTRHDKHWGVTQTWDLPGPVNKGRFEDGYVQGADGGEIDIKANRLQLDGQVLGQTADGLHQRENGHRARGGTLDLDLAFFLESGQSVALVSAANTVESQLKQLFPTVNPLLESPLAITDRFLARSGLRHIRVVSNRAIGIAKDAELSLPVQGELALLAGEIELAGRVSAPSGQVVLDTRQRAEPRLGPSLAESGDIHLADGSRIDVSGLWTNDAHAVREQGVTAQPVAVEGGGVKATAAGDLNFEQGAEITADGGAWLKSNGKLVDGQGGSIALSALAPLNGRRIGSNLSLEGSFHAYALHQGGQLSLTSNEILVGDAFSPYQPPGDGLQPLILAPGLFNSGGFADYSLTSNLNGITLGYDTTIELRQQNRVLDDNFRDAPTGANIHSFSSVQLLDDALRQPTNLSLLKPQSDLLRPETGIDLQEGSKISADAGAIIVLESDTKILIRGTVDAPAGAIRAAVVPPSGFAFQPTQGIFLDSGASLRAPGAVQKTPGGVPGLRDDQVLAGGSVSLNANRGYVILAKDSAIDVSGASAVIDEVRPNGDRPGTQAVPTVHASRAGRIELTAAEGVVLDGDVIGRSDHAHGAEGGSLSVSLLKSLRLDPGTPELQKTFPSGPRVIEVSQERQKGLLDDWEFGSAVPGRLNGLGALSAQQVEAGGFDSLTLKTQEDSSGVYQNQPEVRFVGNVGLATGRQIVLDTPTIGIAPTPEQAEPGVRLDTTYLALGSSLVREDVPEAAGGAGKLTGIARDIELVGGLRLTGVGDTALLSEGDLRLRGIFLPVLANADSTKRNLAGTFAAAGNLTLLADQIYPSTLSRYSISLTGDSDSTLAIFGGGRPIPLLSAAGQLDIQAPNIVDSGVVKAPFGAINLTATGRNLTLEEGAVVSVSADKRVIPFGKTQGGLDWLYPLPQEGTNLVYGLGDQQIPPPTGTVHLKGPNIDLQEGATIDLSGGGNLYAYELVPGSGGSVDLLDPRDPLVLKGEFGYQAKYAILPWLKDGIAPYDPYETPRYDLGVGDSVYLADAAAGLPTGKYTLLPAHYALLPGAYLITANEAANPQPGTVSRTVDGTPIVVGYRTAAGTDFKDYRGQAYAVESGRDFRRRTEYIESTANKFFADQADKGDLALPILPKDAGSLVVEAATRLSLSGAVQGQAAKDGRGGRLDIAGNNLKVVQELDNPAPESGAVLLQARQLDNLKVESLLLGGIRKDDGKTRRISVKSDSVVVDRGVQLGGPEIILAAKEAVEVKEGAHLQAQGRIDSQISELRIADAADNNSDGALLRVSSGPQVDVVRDQAVTGTRGTLTVEKGATIGASGSATLDATSDVGFFGKIDMASGSLSLGADRISLGQVPGGTQGLVLMEDQLHGFSVDELILHSASAVGLYGEFSLQANQTLDIRAPGVGSFGNSGTASLAAAEIKLSNPGDGQVDPLAESGGTLRFKADQVFKFAGGDFSVGGFDAVSIEAGERFAAAGRGRLNVAGNLTVSSPLLAAESGADVRLDATGHAFAFGSGQSADATPGDAGLGAKLAVSADTIALNGRIGLPSGIFTASTEHALKLGANARIDVAGVSQTYAGKTVHTPGGSVALASAHGDVGFGAGAQIDVSGQDRAGSFSLSAPEGTASLQGAITGAAKNSSGSNASLAFDVGRLDGQGASAVFSYLQDTGRAAAFDFRLHQGDIEIGTGSAFKAHDFRLSADQGGITVAGTLNASGATAGSIALAAGDAVRLTSSARLLAGSSAVNEKGGRVFIESTDQDKDGTSGIAIASGAAVDVRGGELRNPPATPKADQIRHVVDGPTVSADGKEYLAGDIHLRALRDRNGDGSNVLGIDLGNASLVGTQGAVAEAVRIYDNVSAIGPAEIAQWQADTRAYMDGLPAGAHPGLTVMPGLEIRGSGDIALNTHWNFRPVAWTVTDHNGVPVTEDGQGQPIPTDQNGKPIIADEFGGVLIDKDGFPLVLGLDFTGQNQWRYGAGHESPGFLTLRAGGSLYVNGKLSDGVAPGQLDDSLGTLVNFDEVIQPGDSWSYRLVAGADMAAADSAGTNRGAGDIAIAPGAAIRTGTGDIGLSAGRNVALGDESSAVYTVGRADIGKPDRFGSYSNFDAVYNFYADYPIRGGNISIAAGGDIQGAETPQFVPDWLVRTGNWGDTTTTEQRGVAWGIALSQADNALEGNLFFIPPHLRGFKQNVGALAGGDISIAAGGNIADLSVVIPTVGKQVGERISSDDPTNASVKFNRVEVHGGGHLKVTAGADIAGGMFYAEKGVGEIRAGGAIAGGKQYTSGPLFSLGDATLNVVARADLAVGTVFNPFMLEERNATGDKNLFSTYSDASRISFSSLGGDIGIENDMKVIQKNYPAIPGNTDEATRGGYPGLYYYPGNLVAQAFSGSMTIKNSVNLAPNPIGNMELFADNSITGGTGQTSPVRVNVSDADPGEIPNPLRPAPSLDDFDNRLNPLTLEAEQIHAQTPVHANDAEPVRIATHSGNISGNTQAADFSFFLPKKVLFESGKDIRNVNLVIQNLSDQDISEVSAKRDIVFDTHRTVNGALDIGALTRFWIAGPGKLQVLAGRNIDLGSSDGIASIANAANPALPISGASLALLAGLTETTASTDAAASDPRVFKIDVAGFLGSYLDKLTADKLKNRPELNSLLARYKIILPAAKDAVAALSPQQQLDLALPLLFDEIRTAGIAAAKHGNQAKYYEPGFEAIKALFPGDKYQGDISLFFSRVHSTFGGDIDLLAPGGLVNAGLTNSALGSKKTSDLGIVVQQQGAINAFVRNDFTVNESRVFTLGGGDITVWSSDGDIDAGRGAKSALSAPPPQFTFDNQGNLVIVFPPVLSGSGIRTASSEGPQAAGNVYLFAPRGVVDAGEAGIGGNNVVVAATAVIGASNIQVSGSSTGVPTAPPPVVVPAGAANAASAAAQAAIQQVADNASQKNENTQGKEGPSSLGVIQVDVLGFGNCSLGDVRSGTSECGG